MPLQTNSTGVSFVYNNLQSTELSSVSGNTNAVTGIPFVTQLDAQSTLIQAGKVPGGTAFRQAPNVPYTAAGNTNAVIVQLDGFETQLSRLNGTFTKSGAFICVTSGTTAVGGSNTAFEGIADIYADGYLDGNSATTWYLHYVGMPQRPFVFIQNYEPKVEVLGFGSEHEINTNTVRIALKHRFVLGYYRFDRSIKVA